MFSVLIKVIFCSLDYLQTFLFEISSVQGKFTLENKDNAHFYFKYFSMFTFIK